MKAVLLGPNGQLGTDVRRVNERRELLRIVPIARDVVDLSKIDSAIAYLDDIEFDALINCSGYHNTDEVEANAQYAFTINAHLARELAALCSRKKARFVHISTDYVFGGQKERIPLEETVGKAPLNVYGASKALGEDLALLTHNDTLILRVASLFGIAGASGKGGNFVETMIRLGKNRGALRVVSDQFMSPSSTEDLAEAILLLLHRRGASGLYHVVNTGQASWYEFAHMILDRAGIAVTIEAIPSAALSAPAMRPPYSVLNNSKIASIVGPMATWQDALDRYLIAKGHKS